MRALAATIAIAILVEPRSGLAGDAGVDVDLLVYWAPLESPAAPDADAAAARDALSARARAAGTAWVDLSPAPAPPPEAPVLHRRAVEAYEALRFDEALAALDAALVEAARTGADGLDPPRLSDLYLYRGLIQTQGGDPARAWEDLLHAAVVDPARVLDPLRFPPRAIEAFQRALDRVRAEPRGELRVDAPADCAVVIDGADAPARTATLPLGDHLVRVTCAGRRPLATRVTLAAATLGVAVEPELALPPSDSALQDLARGRGAATVAVAVVSSAGGAPLSLSMRLIDTASGRVRARAGVSLGSAAGAAADAEAVFDRLLAPPPAAGPSGRRRWYQRGWIWALAGAAAASAVLIPFAIDSGPPSDVVLRPSGFAW